MLGRGRGELSVLLCVLGNVLCREGVGVSLVSFCVSLVCAWKRLVLGEVPRTSLDNIPVFSLERFPEPLYTLSPYRERTYLNMNDIVVTLEVSQFPISWLNW